MTKTTQPPAGLPATALQLPMTGSRGQPLKISQYLREGERLREAVVAYRAAKGEASAEGAPVTQQADVCTECNKPKSYRLPPLETPTPIEGFPLNNPSPAQDVPDYVTIGRVKAARATQAARRGKKAPLTPSGSSELRKRDSVRTWKVAE